jgi:hypothetical protein
MAINLLSLFDDLAGCSRNDPLVDGASLGLWQRKVNGYKSFTKSLPVGRKSRRRGLVNFYSEAYTEADFCIYYAMTNG